MKITIKKTDNLTDLEKDIIMAGVPDVTDDQLKECTKQYKPEEIVIDPDVIKFLEENNIKLEDFINEFKERAGIE